MSLTYNQVIATLQQHANPQTLQGMAKFGIQPDHALGIPIPVLRRLAKEVGKNHTLAQELWSSNIHEARILASMIAEPSLVSPQQMDEWVNAFDSWDVCDQVCGKPIRQNGLCLSESSRMVPSGARICAPCRFRDDGGACRP